MAKLWEGRFEKGLAADMESLNRSIQFDARLWAEDIAGSKAHATMLGAQGILPKAEAKALVDELGRVEADLRSGALAIDMTAEDIHSFIEAELTKRLGDIGKKLHTGRSRNDQVALDMRLFVRAELESLQVAAKELISTLVGVAENHVDTVMPGYTHTQRAQPVSLAHHMLAWCEMLKRDIGRMADARARMDESPLGSGALAGSGFPLDREAVAKSLGFSRVTANSLDSVADRDFVIETASTLAITMSHLSRMAEEIILWSTSEFGFIELDEAYSTGSSMMPQKKNADSAELVRGKTGRVYGALVALLTVFKGIPLSYDKDMQEDKEQLFDAIDTTKICLSVMKGAIGTATIKPDRMREAASLGYLNATDVADYLVAKGMPFRDAHSVAALLVRHCIDRGIKLEELKLEELRAKSPLFDKDVYEAISLDACLAKRALTGGPAPARVREAIAAMKKYLS